MASAAADKIIAEAADQRIVAVLAKQAVISVATIDIVIAARGNDDVVAIGAIQRVVAISRPQVLEVDEQLASQVCQTAEQVDAIVAVICGGIQPVDIGAAIQRFRRSCAGIDIVKADTTVIFAESG